jgi:predicted DsbA family dithiol-disulfide isomerase
MLRIDVWSDVACPWCYVGKRNLEAALAELGTEAEIHWRAFELDPSAPRSLDMPMEELLSKKYGVTLEQAQQMNAQMTETAQKSGLNYRLDLLQLGNTFDAHRLAKFAEARGCGPEMTERLFSAYFTEGAEISDHATLARLGADVGLQEQEIMEVLESEDYADEVRSDEADAQGAGFGSVPTFVINSQFAIPGAQPVDTMVRLLGRVLEGNVT